MSVTTRQSSNGSQVCLPVYELPLLVARSAHEGFNYRINRTTIPDRTTTIWMLPNHTAAVVYVQLGYLQCSVREYTTSRYRHVTWSDVDCLFPAVKTGIVSTTR